VPIARETEVHAITADDELIEAENRFYETIARMRLREANRRARAALERLGFVVCYVTVPV